jgi:hypothetical protein
VDLLVVQTGHVLEQGIILHEVALVEIHHDHTAVDLEVADIVIVVGHNLVHHARVTETAKV